MVSNEAVPVSARSSSVAISEWCKTRRGLVTKFTGLQNAIRTMLDRASPDLSVDLNPTKKVNLEMASQREKYFQYLVASIKKINRNVSKAASMVERLSSEEHTQKHNDGAEDELRQLKTILERIDENIIEFKQKHSRQFDDLASESSDLTKELEVALSVIDCPELPSSTPCRHRMPMTEMLPADMPSEAQPTQRAHEVEHRAHLMAQVASIQAMIDNEGGNTGGWDEHDHEHFRRLRVMYQNDEEMMERCAREISGQRLASVRLHNEWYKRFLAYKQRKRELINEWRARKKTEQQNHINEVEALYKKKELVEHEQHLKIVEKLKKKEDQIRRWKVEKSLHEQEEALRIHQEKERDERIRRQKENHRRKSLKSALEEHRKQNEILNRLEKVKDEKRCSEPHKMTHLQRQQLQARSKQMLDRRKWLQDRKKKLTQPRSETFKELAHKLVPSVNAARDRSRIYRTTESQDRRSRLIREQKSLCTEEETRVELRTVVDHTHRAVPVWRQGL